MIWERDTMKKIIMAMDTFNIETNH